MIDTALKHYIYEVCIDTLFNGIINNFRPDNKKEFSINDEFVFLQHNNSRRGEKPTYTIYYDLKIMNFHTSMFGDEEKMIDITYRMSQVWILSEDGEWSPGFTLPGISGISIKHIMDYKRK